MDFIKGIRTVILDFDGVVVESNEIKGKVMKEIFNRFPEHADDLWQYHLKYISVSRYQKFDYLLETTGRPGDQQLKEQLLHDFSVATLEMMKQVAFVKGAEDFLKQMQAEKFPVYLASVTPIADLSEILEALKIKNYFKNVYGCPPWTKPAAIKDILSKENRLATEALLVGDSYGDQRAAKETGIHFIGRNSGLGFEDPQPEYIIPDLTGLAQLFLSNR